MKYPTDNFVELYFSDCNEIKLTKIVFGNSALPRALVSVSRELASEGEWCFLFEENDHCLAAVVLLLLGAAKLNFERSKNISLICGSSDSQAELLVNEVEKESTWIKKIFGMEELGIGSAREMFHVGRFGEFCSVLLRPDYICGDSVGILQNGSLLDSAGKVQDLILKISSRFGFERIHSRSKLSLLPLHKAVITDEVRHSSAGLVTPKILDIFSKKLEEQLIKNGIDAVKDKIDDLSKRELSYHLSQHTCIEMLPKDEWNISFEFEVINAGFLPISKRTHQYWFEHPQGEIAYDIRDEFGKPIKYTVTKASEKYREIRLELPRVLQALDKIKYKISYRVKGIVERDSFYYLSPRTLTKKLALTVKRYDRRKFENARISVECEGGFMKDNPPELIIENESGVETIRWTQSSPRPGELYRTLWTNQETDWIEQKGGEVVGNVIPFPERPRS